jgi:hypothetical protein
MTTEDMDYFSDGDMAAPENMPEGKRFVGKVTGVETKESEVGTYRKFNDPLRDGRTEVPIITLKVRALKFADGGEFSEDGNLVQSTESDYWVGKEDRVGRHSLASLIQRVTALDGDQLKSMRMQDAARQLQGAVITFEVKHRQGKQGGTFQSAVKIRPASADELALVA